MSDQLQDRMRKLAGPKQASSSSGTSNPAPTPTFVRPPKPFPHRVTLDLSEDDFDALRTWAHGQRLPMAELLRGLVGICRADEQLEAAVVARVRAHRSTETRTH